MVDVVRNRNAPDEVLKANHILSVEDVFQRGQLRSGGVAGDRNFLVATGIINADHEHETVELRFGERVGAFLLDRVLRREDEKGLLQFEGVAGNGDPVFLHRLKHGGLRLRRCPVDFIREDDVGEDGAF